MKILSILFILIGGVLIKYFYSNTKEKIKEVEATETTKISELKEMLSDGMRKYVELKGKITDENMVEAPYSKKQVAYYEYIVKRFYEKRKSNGNFEKEDETILHEKSEQDVCFVDDSCNDSLLLDVSKDCNVRMPITYKKFESDGSVFDFGGIRFVDKPNTTGYEIVERAIDANQHLYVIGEVYKDGDKIRIGKPEDSNRPFIVTTESEEELVKSLKLTAKIQMIIGSVLIIFGIVAFVI